MSTQVVLEVPNCFWHFLWLMALSIQNFLLKTSHAFHRFRHQLQHLSLLTALITRRCLFPTMVVAVVLFSLVVRSLSLDSDPQKSQASSPPYSQKSCSGALTYSAWALSEALTFCVRRIFGISQPTLNLASGPILPCSFSVEGSGVAKMGFQELHRKGSISA